MERHEKRSLRTIWEENYAHGVAIEKKRERKERARLFQNECCCEKRTDRASQQDFKNTDSVPLGMLQGDISPLKIGQLDRALSLPGPKGEVHSESLCGTYFHN